MKCFLFRTILVISQTTKLSIVLNKNIMELQGKVIAVLPERSGVSARGEWKSQSFVIETHEAYPHKMVFDVFGAERLQRFNIQVGQEISVSFDIDAHEYNGRWFNNIRAFDVRPVDPASIGMVPGSAPVGTFGNTPVSTPPAGPSAPAMEDEQDSDLPF
uniref:DUF3127 domain-containing protein n=2 Tax=unclassified Prevotella TaxID=2638335 RepID=A0AB33IY20_9BACT